MGTHEQSRTELWAVVVVGVLVLLMAGILTYLAATVPFTQPTDYNPNNTRPDIGQEYDTTERE